MLEVDIVGEFQRLRGESFTVLTARQMTGTFSNPNDEGVASDGTRFTIGYSETGVIVTAK